MLQDVYLARHSETAWSRSGQHTGLTDLPLTETGEQHAKLLGARLRGRTFAKVLVSPLRRAVHSCELAGFGDVAEVAPDLVEWSYGDYEGRTKAEIHAERPGWNVFRDGGPNGESAEDVMQRADRVVSAIRAIQGDVLLYSSGHFLRALAARWLGLPITTGRYIYLTTTSLSIVGYDKSVTAPVIRLWNDTSHLE